MENLLGDWQAKKDVTAFLNGAAFLIQKGNIVAVEELDKKRSRIRIQIVGVISNWMPETFLTDFERRD